MFGYIIVNKPEMKFREFDCYHAGYCGLCRSLKTRHGLTGQMTLSYDMTFLALLLDALYEPEAHRGKGRCIAHPLRSHAFCRTVFSDYAADMNVLLSYYKGQDDWQDERRLSGRLTAFFLKKKAVQVGREYPEKGERIAELLSEIHSYETECGRDPDAVSGCFGQIMAEIFAWRHDEWEETLRQMGFYLGKFLYLMDAYDDMDRDEKNKSYNVFLQKREEFEQETAFERYVKETLQLMMAECCRAFERLPILENAGILRNILYSGVWCRYEALQEKKSDRLRQGGKDA